MTLSARERAEKIRESLNAGCYLEDDSEDLMIDDIAVQIEEAEREAFTGGTESHGIEGHRQCSKCIAGGWSAAKEKAKDVVLNYVAPRGRVMNMDDNQAIAARISAMEADGE